MALNVGSLFVTLDAKTDSFLSKFASAMQQVEKFSAQTKRVAREASKFSAEMTVVAGAALKLAETVNGQTANAMAGLEKSTRLLAIQVAQTLLPAVNTATQRIREAAQWFAALDPHVKQMISNFAVTAVEVGLAAKVIGTLAGVLGPLAGMLGGVASAIGAMGIVPILEVVAGLAAMAVAVAALHYAWRTNWGGIRDLTIQIINDIGAAWGTMTDFLLDSFSSAVKGVGIMVNKLLDIWGAAAAVWGRFNSGQMQMLKTGIAAVQGVVSGMASSPGNTWKALVASASDAGAAAANGFKEEWSKIFDELGVDKLVGKVKGLFAARGKVIGEEDPNALGDRFNKNAGFDFVKGFASNTSLTLLPGIPEAMKAAQLADVRRALYDQKLADALALNAQRLADLSAGLKGAGQMALSRTGNFGSVVQSGIQGAEAGGPIGAAVMVSADLLTRTKAFATLASRLENILGRVVQAFEPLMQAIGPAVSRIVAAAGMIIEQAIPALQPVFDTLGSVLNSLTPFFVLLGQVFKVLAPVIKALLESLMVIFKIIQPILKPLFDVAKVVLTLVLGIVKGVLDIWNAIIEAIASVIDTAVSIITLGAVKHAGDFARGAEVDTKGMGDALDELSRLTWDDAQATAEHTAATGAATESVQKFAEALENAPQGFRIAIARFAADAGGSSGGASSEGSGSRGKSSAAARRQAFLSRGNPYVDPTTERDK